MVKFCIETERLILRELRDSDLDNMFELDSNPLVHKYLGGKPFTDKKQSQQYIDDVKADYQTYGVSRLAAEEKASGRFIGWCGLRFYPKEHSFNNHFNFYDIGYRLLPSFWGKGYATEASFASLDYGFNELKLSNIYGITEFGNEASHRILLKIGLDYTEDFYHKPLNLKLRWYQLKKEDYATKMS